MILDMVVHLALIGAGLLVVAAAVGVGLLYARWWRNARGVPAWTQFLRTTGYRRAEAPAEPLQVQARRIMEQIFHRSYATRGPWVRWVDGMPSQYRSLLVSELHGISLADGEPMGEQTFQEVWLLEMPGEAGFQMQVLDRRAMRNPAFLEELRQVRLSRHQRWGDLLPQEVRVGEDGFDHRFVVLTDNPVRAAAILADHTLQRQFLELPRVLLVMAQRWVAFDDLEGQLRRRYVGRAISPDVMLSREPAMHEAVARLLVSVARRTGPPASPKQ